MDYIQLKATITPLIIGREILVFQLAEIGFESFVETEDGLEAYIQENQFQQNALEKVALLSNAEFSISYAIEKIEDQNWNKQWEESFEPINVLDNCFIRAPFHEAPKQKDVFDIVIEPKMAFGTGHHATTFLMIKRMLELKLENKNVLDMGCGTGVLAILAKMKHAGKVLAIDNDEWAYNNAVESCENNNVDIEVKLGDAQLIKNSKFDVLIANINRNILVADMQYYVDALNNNGKLLMSGFFSVDEEIITKKATELGLKFSFSDTKDEWMMLEFDN
jgi:ribosomal protein L11 methyltransferase